MGREIKLDGCMRIAVKRILLPTLELNILRTRNVRNFLRAVFQNVKDALGVNSLETSRRQASIDIGTDNKPEHQGTAMWKSIA